MPYIRQDLRTPLDDILAPLKGTGLLPGELNYVISSIIWAQFEQERTYTKANDILGVLEAAKLEFYARKVRPFEDQKIIESGDLI
jgi:hypothetical protein